MATLLVFRRQATPEEGQAIRRVALQLLLLALLTQLVYPVLYPGYIGRHGHAMIILSTVVTTIRNVALVLFTIEVCRMAWRMLGAVVMERTAVTRRD